jgi:cell shape-determining protein MreC
MSFFSLTVGNIYVILLISLILQVKVEIVKMMAEREGYSKENETLRQYRVAFQQLQEDNENLRRELEELRLPVSPNLKRTTR